MNLVLLRQRAQRVVLSPDDRRTQHILKVLRRKPVLAASPAGDPKAAAPIAVGIVGGTIGSAVLRSVGQDGSITLECAWPPVDAYSTSDISSLPLDVLVGLARPETCKKVLRELATLGARSITFVLSELSDRSYTTSKLWRDGEWENHLQRGAEQAFRTTLPTVHHCSSLSRALRGLGGATPLVARSDPRPFRVPAAVSPQLRDNEEGCEWLPRTRLLCHDGGDGTTPSIFTMRKIHWRFSCFVLGSMREHASNLQVRGCHRCICQRCQAQM
jgi:hypothetical protein